MKAADPGPPRAPTGRWRSLLFTPADRPDRYTKAWSNGAADVVCADLEDAVPPSGRPKAREMLADALRSTPAAPGTRRAARINAWPGAVADLEAIVPAGPELIVLPKVESATDASSVARRAAEVAAEAGVRVPGLVAILETPRGVLFAQQILSACREVVAVCFGAEDLAAATGMRRSPGNEEIRTARQWVGLAAAAHNVPALDMITADFRDLERCRREAAEARAWGFAGKMCIHPTQAAAVHEAFQPTEDEVAWAREVLAASEANNLSEGGVAVVRGSMVDVPVIRRARRILDDAANR